MLEIHRNIIGPDDKEHYHKEVRHFLREARAIKYLRRHLHRKFGGEAPPGGRDPPQEERTETKQ